MVGCRSFMLQIYQAQPSLPRPICQCSGSEKDDWPSMRLLIKVTFLILSAKLFWRFRKGIESLFVILPDCGLTFASNLELQGLITSHCLVVWSPVGKSPSLFVKNPSPPTTHWSVRGKAVWSLHWSTSLNWGSCPCQLRFFFNQVGKLQRAID